jgi:acyl transferase domain-containing protein/acyl carrier protein
VFPDAPDAPTFWSNIVAGHSAISPVDPDRWDPAAFFDADRTTADRSYCRVGGFIRDWRFDGRAFRIPPATVRVMDRAQQYALTAAREAFTHAGLDRRPFDRNRTAVIVGLAAGRLEREDETMMRLQLPLIERALHAACDRHGVAAGRRVALIAGFREEYNRALAETTEDSFAGLCPNVTAGRIADFLDLHGASYVVDAACASSLAAVDCAVDALRCGDADLVLCGGVHAHMGLSFFVGFSKFQGLSEESVRPFDAAADGFLLGEGAGLFVLKRLDDAMRDGDQVWAVIRGLGSSSDGREKGIGAPNPKAQVLAMRRAMDEAGYSASTIQFVETHGAGTAVGDPTELAAMFEAFGPDLAPGQRIGISAVKSQIGHLMGAAGAAGLMKAILSLHHGVMPPTINHVRPNPAIPWDSLPFDVITAPRPWPANRDGLPRRANVSSFGFGGNNYHLALEAFDPGWHATALQRAAPTASKEPVAIIGLGACLPQAPDVETFWQNVLHGASAITEVPPDRWDGDAGLYVDEDPDAPDKTVARVGGFVAPPHLDGRRLRISPATLRQVDQGHKQLLASALAAIDATRILDDPAVRHRTAVVVGDSGGSRELLWAFLARLSARRGEMALIRLAGRHDAPVSRDEAEWLGADIVREVTAGRPPITEDSVVGIATSIGPARIAKGLDFMGAHMVVDAACASSLAALSVAVRGLQGRKWDAVVTGGVAGGVTPQLSVVASKAKAHSASGSRPFDADADGFVAGDGAVVFVLKRLSDAMAAGDRIYGVIRGHGASANGRGNSMYAPDSSAQTQALHRAYADAGCTPASIQYVECHATSTPVGDAAELATLQNVFGDRAEGGLAVGALKAQIGHTLAASGAAGLLKTVLGLDRKTLPPTPAVARPIPGIDGRGPFRLVTTPAPWPSRDAGPRRAGVNAFGFGGTNWHTVVEEFVPEYHQALIASLAGPEPHPAVRMPLAAAIDTSVAESPIFVAAGADAQLLRKVVADLAPGTQRLGSGPFRLAFVARSKAALQMKVDLIAKHYRPGTRSPLLEGQGIYAAVGPEPRPGATAGLFPGQGPQYADMLRDLADEYAIVRRTIDEADDVLREVLGRGYAELMFTASRSGEERAALEASLASRSDVVQPVLVTAGVALHRLAVAHGVQFATLAGHSLGEYAALVAAGALDFAQAVRAAHSRGVSFGRLAGTIGAGLMATVAADAEIVARMLTAVNGDVAVANRNCPSQTVISGEARAVQEAAAALEANGFECRILPIAGAFHSRRAAPACRVVEEAVAALVIRPPVTRVLSSVDLDYYEPGSDCAERIRKNLADQLVTPVDFIALVERLQRDGCDLFVEMGPKNALTGFVDEILGPASPHRALFLNHPKVGEIPQLDRFLAQHALLQSAATETPVRAADAASDGPRYPKTSPAAPAPAAPTWPEPSVQVSTTHAARRPRGMTDAIWITGVSVGLPGRGGRVFSDDGLDRLLAGACLIEPVPEVLQDRLVSKRITRLVKSEAGEPHLTDVKSREEAVKLAGQRGGFSLADDFGVADDWLGDADISYQLAVAAGLECLRDARIPLQRAYKRTSRGGSLPTGWMLPRPLQDETGVVFASLFPGHNTLHREAERYYTATYGTFAAGALREQYLRRLEEAKSDGERLEADQWFIEQRGALNLNGGGGAYRFNRNYIAECTALGNARFAQLVRARGPNLAVNAACASTAVALATAEDMIRCGRARRVVVLAADDPSSEMLFEWVGAGFLAAGAAATDRNVAEAALPFDRRRHGMILGMGAVGFVLESESAARARGLEPVAQLLGVRIANSASHLTRPDGDHVVAEMDAFLRDMQERHGIDARQLAPNLVYGSHETFTSPSGGIGAVEGRLLKQVFGERWREVLVVNTKAATGHAQGASLQDAILMKGLQAGRVPPVLHSTEIDPELSGIQLSGGGATHREYALGFSAGFGSQVAMWLTRVVTRADDRVVANVRYQRWLQEVTGFPDATLTVTKRVLEVHSTMTAGRAIANAEAPVAPVATPVPAARNAPVPSEAAAVIASAAAVLPPAPAGPRPAVTLEEITERVLATIEEKTSYERRYLELDLDLEADLGIDTIKQAQVMARLRDVFDLPKEKGLRVKDFPTLRHVVEYVRSKVEARSSADPAGELPDITPEPATPPVADLPAVDAAPLAPSAPDRQRHDAILETVLAIVEKQTGYEREALDQDLDLEADLGVDTIKQAQVMARLRETFNLPREQGIRVKDFPTIRHVVDYVVSRQGGGGSTPAPQVTSAFAAPPLAAETTAGAPPGPAPVSAPVPPRSGIQRLAVRWGAQPLASEQPNDRLDARWSVLITDDGLGVAQALSALLSRRGARAEIVGGDADVAAARTRLGRVLGLVLLHPLAADPAVAALDGARWREVLNRKIVASFSAIKSLQPDLRLVAGVTAMAGPYGWRGQLMDPAGSGVTGLLKALRQESDAVLVKAVDAVRPATRHEAEQIAVTILQEIEQGGRRVEAGYRDGIRLVPRVIDEPVDLSGTAHRRIDSDSVIVAVGGSRGITAAVVRELARRYRARFALVATRPLPGNVAELAALDRQGRQQLKDRIARGWRARVTGAKPIEIERKLADTLQAIEAFRTMQACESAGSTVSYHTCDVRDEPGLRALIKQIAREHGRIDGVIFGAGVIDDKLIADKTIDSFERVLAVKAEGIFNLYKALDGVPLSFLAAFSSVAGRFGNIGQADYAAANEVTARFVSLMQAARPATRCVAFDWTAWSDVGLAARSGVIDVMKDVGFEALSPAQGARFFHEELVYASGPEEIVVAGADLPVDRDGQVAAADHPVPGDLAGRARAGVFVETVHAFARGGWLSATSTIEPRIDTWLGDHVIDGAPLVPAVFGIEMMAEAATLLFPGFHVSAIRDLQLHLAVKVLKDRPVTLKISAAGRTGDTDDERVVAVEVASDFIGPDGRTLIANRVHYTCEVVLQATAPVAVEHEAMSLPAIAAPCVVPRLYGEGGSLPHGSTFQVIEQVDRFDSLGVVASVAALDEGRLLPALNGHRLLTLPFAREAAFQAAGLWGILEHGNFGLPHGCRALRRFGTPAQPTRLHVRVVPKSVDAVRIEYDIDLIGDDDRLYDRMEGFYTVNPLTATEGNGQAATT